jgi:hypothetical protein
MKKIGLHIDALAVIIIVFIASFGFNLYQRYQYSDLLKEHIALQQRTMGMEFSLASMDARLKFMEQEKTEAGE